MKSVEEIIVAALRSADEAGLKAATQKAAKLQPASEALPYAAGCSCSGHEVRLPGVSERQAAEARNAHGRGYHAVFCTHHVPFWKKCSRCGRSVADAAKQVPIVIASLKRL